MISFEALTITCFKISLQALSPYHFHHTMVNTCSVMGCSNVAGHRFPHNPDLCHKWRLALKRAAPDGTLWKPSKHSVVCHAHFRYKDYQKGTFTGARRLLKEDAVPRLLLAHPPPTPYSRRKNSKKRFLGGLKTNSFSSNQEGER